MRILLMCEGQNEEVLLNHLLNADALCFTRDDLIGDKQNEKLSIPKDLKDIVSNKEIFKYCTKPELEILLILNEGLEKEYEKVKSYQSPKTFAKKTYDTMVRSMINHQSF